MTSSCTQFGYFFFTPALLCELVTSKEFLDFGGSRWAMEKKVALLLLELNYDACSVSVSAVGRGRMDVTT